MIKLGVWWSLVRLRAKPVLVVVVVVAVLYVLISPLPEMVATNSVRSVAFIVAVLFSLLAAALAPFLLSPSRQQVVVASGLSRSLLCTRLC